MIEFFKFSLESWTHFFGVIVLLWTIGLSICVALSPFKVTKIVSEQPKRAVTITDDSTFITVTGPTGIVSSFKQRPDGSGFDRI